VVTDQDGRTVGVGSLGAGFWRPGKLVAEFERCEHTFAVTVEPEADRYAIAIGGPQRGSVQFTVADLEQPVELELDYLGDDLVVVAVRVPDPA
jgi:hypothetical protein